MRQHRHLLGAALLTMAVAGPLSAQAVQDWQYKWFWGVRGGVMSYELPNFGRQFTGVGGAEWLITARRVALHLGYDQSFAGATDSFTVNGLSSPEQVSFDGIRQIQIDVVALIGDKAFQPIIGGGFVIETLTNAHSTASTSSTTVADAINNAASGGFLHLMAGAQYRMGKKLAIFGNFGYTTQGRTFLLAGSAMTFEGGVRYAFLGAKENDPTTRR
jgi:hypothetical protein